jgi:hypothetical protein
MVVMHQGFFHNHPESNFGNEGMEISSYPPQAKSNQKLAINYPNHD